VQIKLLLMCNVKQVSFCIDYINVLYAQNLSFRGEENELAFISVCECMCGCECDVNL